MEVLGALHHSVAYEDHLTDFRVDKTTTTKFDLLTSIVLCGCLCTLFQGQLLLLLMQYSSTFTIELGHPAFVNLDLVELARFMYGGEYLGDKKVNPMATLLSEDGGRYEEAEVTITLKQGEVVKYASGQPSFPPTNDQMVNTTLKCGSSGAQVAQLQNQLKDLGFFLHDSTGYFGEITEAAVTKFQLANNLIADGMVGPQTSGRLSQLSTSSPTIQYSTSNLAPMLQSSTPSSPQTMQERGRSLIPSSAEGASIGRELYLGSQGLEVEQLQMLLKQTGNYDGPVTGYFGDLTRQAVEGFQLEKELDNTGIVGMKTFLALVDEMN